MNEVAIWSLEEQFWMEAEIYYQSALDPECIMGFPAPVGIIVGKAILESLAQAPRWAAIEMGDCGLVRPTPDLIALGYRARATRRGSRALPSVLHLLLSGERRWLETVPASPKPHRSARA